VFARDGDIVPVSVMHSESPAPPVPVLRPQTAQALRRMLELAAGEEGTAASARVSGYRVAGKTGTARKLRDGRYSDAYVASFVGFAPASNARVVIAVMIDDPHRGRYYGGDVAAPVFCPGGGRDPAGLAGRPAGAGTGAGRDGRYDRCTMNGRNAFVHSGTALRSPGSWHERR